MLFCFKIVNKEHAMKAEPVQPGQPVVRDGAAEAVPAEPAVPGGASAAGNASGTDGASGWCVASWRSQ